MTSPPLELIRVQHQLDQLASARLLNALSPVEEVQYQDLCIEEHGLLAGRA